MTTSLTFEKFCADRDLLGPWFTGPQRNADSQVETPQLAAARAAHAATTDFASASSGTVLVLVPGSTEQRHTVQYLHAFFEQKALAPYAARTLPDGVELVTGVVIEVSANAKRLVRDALATVELTPQDLIEDIDMRNLARTLLLVSRNDFALTAKAEAIMGLPAGELTEFHNRTAEAFEARAVEWRRKNVERALKVEASKTSVPVVPRREDWMFPQDGNDYFSPEWEERNALRKMTPPARPRVLHARPR